MSGCTEHIGFVSQLLKDAKKDKGDMAVLWLNLKDASGTIPQSEVEEALKRHHVSYKITELILDYYYNFHMRRVFRNTKSTCYKFEKGIITGFTISATPSALTMNMPIKSAEAECYGQTTRSGLRHPEILAYMDDMMVSATSILGVRWLLK